MNLRELIKILDKDVELVVYASDGSHTMHLYDKAYIHHWHEGLLKKKVIHIDPFKDSKTKLEVYLEDYHDANEEEI